MRKALESVRQRQKQARYIDDLKTWLGPGDSGLFFADHSIAVAVAGAGDKTLREPSARTAGALHSGFSCGVGLITGGIGVDLGWGGRGRGGRSRLCRR